MGWEEGRIDVPPPPAPRSLIIPVRLLELPRAAIAAKSPICPGGSRAPAANAPPDDDEYDGGACEVLSSPQRPRSLACEPCSHRRRLPRLRSVYDRTSHHYFDVTARRRSQRATVAVSWCGGP